MLFHSPLGYVSHAQQAATRRRARHGLPKQRARARLSFEALEGRDLLSTFVVDRLSDLGQGNGLTGDLRYCITQANSLPGDDTITFAVTGTIQLTGPLPNLSSNIELQGPGASNLAVRRNTASAYRIFTVTNSVTVFLSGLTITGGGVSEPELGGGIFNQGTLTLNHATISGNYAGAKNPNPPGSGGGIYNGGTLTLNNTTVNGNMAYSSGGGGIFNDGTLALNDSTVSNNYAEGGWGGSSGGILNSGTMTLTNSTVRGNFSELVGGGIENVGTLALNNTTISGNGTGLGGGIFNVGTLTLNNGTISGNAASFGGGIYNSRTVTANNSTISGNRSSRSQAAGGITNVSYSSRDATVVLVNSTVSNNSTTSMDRTGSQIYTRLSGTGPATVRFRNTLISGNGAQPNCFADVGGTFVSEGHNLSNDDSGDLDPDLGDLPSTDPLLGPLQDNGGLTFTHALLPGSPALDAGDNEGASEFDQRGLPRIIAGTVDIGAFEVQPGPATGFRLDAPAEVVAGTPFDVTLYALDDYGHVATGYVGTVTFFTTDKGPGVTLPADYTFTTDDQGIHSFAAETVLITPGAQSLGAWDTASGASGEVVLAVMPSGAPGREGSRPELTRGRLFAADLVRGLARRNESPGGLWGALSAEPSPLSAE